MIIVGAKGFAKEILEIFHQNGDLENLCFYDDVNSDILDTLYDSFKIIRNIESASLFFKNIDNRFAIGIGDPKLRKMVSDKFENIGGKLTSSISKNAEIGTYNVVIDKGCNILSGVKISNDVTIGKGTMVYYNTVITHDVVIGDFCELSPSVNILGRVTIGNAVQIGSGVVIFPDVKIGNGAIIGAGAVVRNDVPENVMVAGVPAVIKKKLI